MTPPPSSDVIKAIDFGPAGSANTGYSSDDGSSYTAARGYGWETLTGGVLNLTSETRQRNVDADQRLDTLVHMQSGRAAEGRWQVDIANGTYSLTIGLGDPSYTDSRHVLRAEGTEIANFTPTAAKSTTIVTANATVTDGKLTLDQTGGSNTKIGFIEVRAAAGAPPVTAPAPALKSVDFGPSGTAVSGYLSDTGAAFTTARGYGWETLTGTALNLTTETRERNAVTDKRLDTIVHMESGRTAEGRWQLVIPNGTYAVTLGIGDPSYTDSYHVVRAEGVVLANFVPTADKKTDIVTGVVNVSDGKLTLDQVGGDNTKLGFVEVRTSTSTPTVPTPPPTTGTGSLQITTPHEYLGLGKHLVFSTVSYNTVPDQKITLKNTGTAVVNVTGLSFTGPDGNDFQLTPGQATKFAIQPGATATVSLRFVPIYSKVHQEVNSATLAIATDSLAPQLVTLGGMNAFYFEDVHEPSLQAIFDSLGYKVKVGVTDEKTNKISSTRSAVGDEVLMPFFKAADTTKPVELIPLAHYGSRNTYDAGGYGFNAKGSRTNHYEVLWFPGGTNEFGGENQKLLPGINKDSTINFTPTGAYSTFSVWSNYKTTSSDDTLNDDNNAKDVHAMRIYPAKRADGTVVPNSYLVGIDSGISGKNWDYQDVVFLLKNVVKG